MPYLLTPPALLMQTQLIRKASFPPDSLRTVLDPNIQPEGPSSALYLSLCGPETWWVSPACGPVPSGSW